MQGFCYGRKLFVAEHDFLHEKHVNYLIKILKRSASGSPLGVDEVNRLSSLFFVVSGLDLLGALDSRLSSEDKSEIIDWIYSYQVDVRKVVIDQVTEEKRSGHAGFRVTSIIDEDIPNDCGSVTMTYCALAALVILGDSLDRVDRKSIIAGINHIQLPDGSFTPSVLGGECDMRIVYSAVAVSNLLNDWSGMNQMKCIKFIRSCLSYEGAFAQRPGAEAHGGSTFCAVASLKLMSKLEETLTKTEIDKLARWCVSRLEYGFSGRPNKDQDTCYSFWIGACLVILEHYEYIEQRSLLEFLLLAQEERGGLSKVPAFYSDPLHTYLGIAGMTFIDNELCAKRKINLLKIDPALMVSERAKTHLKEIHKNWARKLEA